LSVKRALFQRGIVPLRATRCALRDLLFDHSLLTIYIHYSSFHPEKAR